MNSNWIKTIDRLPNNDKRVLIVYMYLGYRQISIGFYVPPKTLNAEDYFDDDIAFSECSEFDEKNDKYWVKEGWFVEIPEFEGTVLLDRKDITHWQILPELP
jgi:hypothetical protein